MNKLVISDQQFKGLVAKICRDITLSDWRPDYVVGLTRGGLLPAVMISHYFNIPCETLKVSLRDHADCESNLWMAEDALGVVPMDQKKEYGGHTHIEMLKKNILIVDDINDTGATINWILNDWPSGCFPDAEDWKNDIWNVNVRFAVVVDNLSSDCLIKLDYTGMEVNKAEEDVWVDFPYEDWWTK
jgi:uncharacterized protein